MRKSQRKWLVRAARFLAMVETDLMGAARFRLKFKKTDKLDRAVNLVRALPQPRQRKLFTP